MASSNASVEEGADGAAKGYSPSSPVAYEDCTPCKIMGSATFIGLGIYTLTLRLDPKNDHINSSKPLARTFNRFVPHMRAGFGLSFIALGIYRLLS